VDDEKVAEALPFFPSMALQMRKTVLLQPYIKFLVISLFLTSFFVIYMHFFGIPRVVKIASSPVYVFLGRVLNVVKRLLVSVYWSILAILPIKREKQTSFDVVLAFMSASWARLLSIFRLYKG
jgi:hypothetical protein